MRMQDDRIHARATDDATATHAGKQLRKEQQQQLGASANAWTSRAHLEEDAPNLRVVEPAAGTSTHGHATRIVALLLPERRARRLLAGSSSVASARALLPLLRLDHQGPVAMQVPSASGSTPSTAGRETANTSSASAGTAALAKQSPGQSQLFALAPASADPPALEAVSTTPSVWLLVISLPHDTTPQSNGPASQALALGTSGYPQRNSVPASDGSDVKGQPTQPATAAAALAVLMRSSPASLSAALALSQPWSEGSSRQVTLGDAEAAACMRALTAAETTILNGGHASHLSGETRQCLRLQIEQVG